VASSADGRWEDDVSTKGFSALVLMWKTAYDRLKRLPLPGRALISYQYVLLSTSLGTCAPSEVLKLATRTVNNYMNKI
jgi:hypothetical protein